MEDLLISYNLEDFWAHQFKSFMLPSLCSKSLRSFIHRTHLLGICLFEGFFQCLTELYLSIFLQSIWLKEHFLPHLSYQHCSCSHRTSQICNTSLRILVPSVCESQPGHSVGCKVFEPRFTGWLNWNSLEQPSDHLDPKVFSHHSPWMPETNQNSFILP